MEVIININDINENLEKLKSYGDFFPVLKSNAYGIGLEFMTKMCLDFNLKTFFVRDVREAQRILEIDSMAKIITLNGIENFEYTKNIMPAILSLRELEIAKQNHWKYWIHFDIGINRTGIKDYFKCFSESPEGVLAHFSISNIYNTLVFDNEKKLADEIFSHFECTKSLSKTSCISLESSYINRPGLGLYNFSKCAISASANVIDIKYVKRGDYVGYDSTYIAQKDIILAVVNCGYSSGFNRNYIEINGNICTLIGKISMELTLFDITEFLDIKVGDLAKITNFDHATLYNICTNNVKLYIK